MRRIDPCAYSRLRLGCHGIGADQYVAAKFRDRGRHGTAFDRADRAVVGCGWRRDLQRYVFAFCRSPPPANARRQGARGLGEVADFNDNVVKVGLSGGTLAYKDQELTLYGYGVAAQVWMSLNYSPVLDAYRRDRDRARNHGSSAGGSAQRGRARSIAQDVLTPPPDSWRCSKGRTMYSLLPTPLTCI